MLDPARTTPYVLPVLGAGGRPGRRHLPAVVRGVPATDRGAEAADAAIPSSARRKGARVRRHARPREAGDAAVSVSRWSEADHRGALAATRTRGPLRRLERCGVLLAVGPARPRGEARRHPGRGFTLNGERIPTGGSPRRRSAGSTGGKPRLVELTGEPRPRTEQAALIIRFALPGARGAPDAVRPRPTVCQRTSRWRGRSPNGPIDDVVDLVARSLARHAWTMPRRASPLSRHLYASIEPEAPGRASGYDFGAAFPSLPIYGGAYVFVPHVTVGANRDDPPVERPGGRPAGRSSWEVELIVRSPDGAGGRAPVSDALTSPHAERWSRWRRRRTSMTARSQSPCASS